MKTEIRYCNECKRRTIQAEDYYFNHNFVPTKVEHVWYCPQCGIQWKVVKKMEDVNINELS